MRCGVRFSSLVFVCTRFKNGRGGSVIKTWSALRTLPSATRVVFLPRTSRGWVSLKRASRLLYREGITSLFVEGGAKTAGRFVDERMADKLYVFISPRIIGGAAARSSFGGEGVGRLRYAPFLRDVRWEHIGNEVMVCGYPVYPSGHSVYPSGHSVYPSGHSGYPTGSAVSL